MASARVRVHGSLQAFLARSRRAQERVLPFSPSAAVKDLIEAAGVPHPEVEYVLVDGEAVDFAFRVTQDCEIDVHPATAPPHPQPAIRVGLMPPTPHRFVLDVHLGKLASSLRLLGFDTLWSNAAGDAELARTAAEEERILLTRDVGLLKRAEVKYGYFPRSSDPRAQLDEVIARFSLRPDGGAFSRCLKCNGALAPVDKAEVEALLPTKVSAQHTEFLRCTGCRRVYWKGTHHAALAGRLSRLRF